MSQECNCSLFDGYICRSEKSRKECGGNFYKCPDVNTKTCYTDALAHFKALEAKINTPEGKPSRTNFGTMKTRGGCDGNLLKRDRKTGEYKPNWDEDFICKCYYLCYTGRCQRDCERKFDKPKSDYEIIDYQVPPLSKHCGKVDLLIRGDDTLYLTEVKPPQGNEETLLRMICEILTHASTLVGNRAFHVFAKESYGLDVSQENVRPAIMFFDGTAQQKEYENCCDEIKKIIGKYGIKVLQCDKATRQIVAKN